MKPRNYVALALLKCKKKSGEHRKTFKAMRREDKVKFKRDLYEAKIS